MVRRTPAQYDWHKLLFDDRLLDRHFTVQASKQVEFIGIHHMVIRDKDSKKPDALDALGDVWRQRPASAQYGIDGPFVGQYVNDKDYAWACGNEWGNAHGIHIEHANKTLDEPGTKNDYIISEQTWKTGAKLAAYLHFAYGLGRPVKDKTIRKHSSFGTSECPGPYLGGTIWDAYVREAQRVYDSIAGKKAAPAAKPKPKPATAPRSHPLVKPWVLPAGHYYGDIKGPAQSHGGYYAEERDEVRNIQAWLIYHGLVPGIPSSQWRTSTWADGIWEPPTTAAVRRWFAKYAPTEPHHDRIYSDDYARLVR